ncbi:MAG: anhydro-N-acetylmuramic acid kinase [Hyphomicrobium sp.]|nr:anhydro-N-acetylmuramic acid kinase [Hyphomicrobium sp.]
MRALGLMSGTSLDGIDVAMIETDGESQVVRGPAMTFAYEAEMRQVLTAAIADARGLQDRWARPGCLKQAERQMTEAHASAVDAFLGQRGIDRGAIDVIGFHGQTVLHRPGGQLTVQLGLGGVLADLTRVPVVYDLRGADVAAGGQGAPLVPVYHQALTAKLSQRPMAVVNIGGVANVTWIGRDGRLIAFDTGPGNALIDDWMMRRTNRACDLDGASAARGRVLDDILHAYLNDPFFAEPPPKSLDRNAFTLEPFQGVSLEDGAATLAAFTAGAIAKAREHMPEEPALWIVAGGGRRNKTIMRLLAGTVQNAVIPAETAGLDGDSLEAEAWAYLAVRSMKRLAITFPGTTGVAAPMTGGTLVLPKTVAIKASNDD